jgi:hypothetical protein
LFFRYIRSKETNIIRDPYLVLENIKKFKQIVNDLNWKGPIVCMTDCTKVRPKLIYCEEFGCIVGSILSHNETIVNSYDDITSTIKKIKDGQKIATQVRVIVLKVIKGFVYLKKWKFNQLTNQFIINQLLDTNWKNPPFCNCSITNKR